MVENRTVEITAATIEEAIEEGLEKLQVSRESVIVEIVEEPRGGFLGVGSKEATVRMTTAARPRSEIESHHKAKTPESGEIAMPTVRYADDDEISNDLKVGRDKLREIVHLMGYDEVDVIVEVSEYNIEDEDATYVLQVRGEELNRLIGRRGDTLAALQYITRLVASRDLQRRSNFVIDVGGYKSKRSMQLFQLANRMANQAVERGRTVKLEPMPPHERRIIHMALKNRGDVRTNSVGEGKYRKVTIIPRKN